MIILLVDDERDTRTVARIALKQLGGFTVVEAASGPEALEAVSRARPDAVILDVMMPGMDGPAVLAALRADPTTADLPVIFLTAKAMPDEIERLRALGVAAIHTKPFDPTVFARDVREALTRRAHAPGAATIGASAPAAAADSGLDMAVLARLKGLTTETGADLIGELIELFATSSPEVLRQFRELLATYPASAATIERLAHTLKGAASTLGATDIADAAKRIESLAHTARVEDIRALVDRIGDRLTPAVARLRAERARLLGIEPP